MKWITIILLLVLMSWSSLSGQSPENIMTQSDLNRLANLTVNSQGIPAFDLTNRTTKGSPYLFEPGTQAKVIFKKNDAISPRLLLNVDVMDEIIWFKLNSETAARLPNNLIKSIVAYSGDNDSTYIELLPIASVEGTNNPSTGFYEALYEDTPKLLKRVSKHLVEADYQKPFSTGKTYDEYVESKSYFLQDSNGQYQKIKLKDKAILKLLGNKSARAAAIKKKYKLSLNNEADVVLLLQYLNQDEK